MPIFKTNVGKALLANIVAFCLGVLLFLGIAFLGGMILGLMGVTF
jgi:hypothetical protein